MKLTFYNIYIKNIMKNQLVINENEKDDILSQHDNIDQKLFNFLIRRAKVKESVVVSNVGEEPLKIIMVSFEGYPGYGLNSYWSKKTMETAIVEMLYENDITEYIYDMDEQNPERQKIIKTIRKFLNFILTDQK
jgi:hypothetical protein